MNHIYIFNHYCRGAAYGVGTYLNNLQKIFDKSSGFKVTRVELFSDDDYITLTFKDRSRTINIPSYKLYSKEDDIEKKTNIDNYDKIVPLLLAPYVDSHENNIFHLNYTQAEILGNALISFFGGNLVLTVHYTEWSFRLLGNKRKIQKIICSSPNNLNNREKELLDIFRKEQALFAICDLLIAISMHSFNDLLRLYNIPKYKLALINNALFIPNYAKSTYTKRDFNINNDEKIILFVGRIDKIKGVDLLIDAFDIVVKQLPNTRLIIIGDGKFENILKRQPLICSKISFTGFLSKKQLYEYYKIADIGVIPSIHEEFGYTAIEMMMHGVPIIANSNTGLSEIIINDFNGLCIYSSYRNRKKYITELSSKIIALILDLPLQKRLALRGKEVYMHKYNGKIFKAKMIELYNKLSANAYKLENSKSNEVNANSP